MLFICMSLIVTFPSLVRGVTTLTPALAEMETASMSGEEDNMGDISDSMRIGCSNCSATDRSGWSCINGSYSLMYSCVAPQHKENSPA